FHNADIWQREGASILGDVTEYRSLAWSGPDYVIRWVAPPSNAVGFNIRSDPNRQPAVDLAVAKRASTLSRFTDLVIGGKGVVIYVPVFQDNEYRGMVSGVLGSGNWLRSLIDGRFSDHHFELLAEGTVEQTVTADAPKAGDDWALPFPIAIQNARWALRVTPTQEYVERSRSPLPDAGLALGTAVAALLALATYFYQAAHRRARDLNQANRNLTQDIARRRDIEQKLRETEQRTQLIIKSAKDCAIIILDTDGGIAIWDADGQALNGYTPEEIIEPPLPAQY